jgi:hypothetical protein
LPVSGWLRGFLLVALAGDGSGTASRIDGKRSLLARVNAHVLLPHVVVRWRAGGASGGARPASYTRRVCPGCSADAWIPVRADRAVARTTGRVVSRRAYPRSTRGKSIGDDRSTSGGAVGATRRITSGSARQFDDAVRRARKTRSRSPALRDMTKPPPIGGRNRTWRRPARSWAPSPRSLTAETRREPERGETSPRLPFTASSACRRGPCAPSPPRPRGRHRRRRSPRSWRLAARRRRERGVLGPNQAVGGRSRPEEPGVQAHDTL